MAEAVYPTIAVIGCGLIGSSIARAARAHGAADRIVVFDTSAAVRQRVLELGIADAVVEDAAEAARGADLVILAAHAGSLGSAAQACAPGLAAGATLTDVGGVKGAVAEQMAAAAPKGVFVIPGHPIAGTEFSGPDAGFAELFHQRWTILTPQADASRDYQAAVARLTRFWERMGAKVELMDERHHDLVLAVTSHLPHLIAYNIVGTAADLEQVTQAEVMKYSAGGFRDFTRIAASDPVMWRDIFLLNKDAVLEVLARFTEDLQALSRSIRRDEGDSLQALFTRTREIRRGVIAAGQESADPNWGRDKGR